MRVVRVSHSAVVPDWRRRERELRARGVDVALVSARVWDEGGSMVALEPTDDPFVTGAATVGRHPFRFAFDPRPIWRALRRPGALDVIDIHEEPASLAAIEVYTLAWLARRTGRGTGRAGRTGGREGRAAVCLYSAQNITKRYPPPFRWTERFLLRRVDAVHTCNDEAGQVLRAKGFSGRLANLGLGVDVERFTAADDASPVDQTDPVGASSGPLRVGYVGRLEGHKGVAVLVEAVAARPGVTLEIVGDGPTRPALAELIDGLGVADRVTLRGPVDHDDLPDTYRRFDVVAVPSLTTPGWIEQFGRVAVEAMACGVAVVVSDSGALPQVVGEAGVRVVPGDVPAWARALAELSDRPDQRTRLAAAGRARALEFSWSAVAARQLDLYRQLDDDPRRPAAGPVPSGRVGA